MFVHLSVLVLAVAGGVQAKMELPPEMQEMVHQLEETCKEATGVDPDIIAAARTLDFKEDANFKCFLKCMMTNMQVLGDDGELDHDVIEQSMPEELKKLGAMDVVEKCRSTKGSDLCDTAFLLLKCFIEEGKDLAEFFV